jgi:subtilisin family serine protease
MKQQYKNVLLVLLIIFGVVYGVSSGETNAPDADVPWSPTEVVQVRDTVAAGGEQSAGILVANATNTATPSRSKILNQVGPVVQHRYYLQRVPDDPKFGSNWALAKIQAEQAWDMTTGSSEVTVAVIDSGYALNHQDLQGRWRTNDAEQGMTAPGDVCWSGVSVSKATNGCDDDQNGYVDDWRGYDFFNDDNNVQAGTTNPSGDGVDHGTLVAGVIGASVDNAVGGAGVDWAAAIMPLQIFSDDGEAYTNHVVEAIEYAVDNGADIINLSLGTNAPDVALLAAVQYARSNGVLVVAASGNCVGSVESFCTSLPDAGRMLYPANFSEVLSVGATTSTDARASFSSYGSELDMVAPGVGVGPLPTYVAGNATTGYATASGTSFAAPLTAGVAALLLAENPNLTVAELLAVLTESVEKPSGLGTSYRNDQLGQGRLNAYRAVLMARAYAQKSSLGAAVGPNQAPGGGMWRSRSGSIVTSEWLLVGCRVAPAQTCSAVATGGSAVRFQTALRGKAGEYQFIYISGSNLPAGSSTLSVHSNNFAQSVANLSR